jgi:hypothetical protein
MIGIFAKLVETRFKISKWERKAFLVDRSLIAPETQQEGIWG